MKARKVKGIDVEAPLPDAIERIIAVRLEEMCSFIPAALDPAEVEALHDMRIAAKRLRYLLELSGFCFGSYASRAARRVRHLQDLLGEIHDCDVMLPRVLEHLDALRATDAARVRALGAGAADLDPGFAGQAPHRADYRGLEVLAVYLRARRDLLFERFARRWLALERDQFASRLAAALGERATV
jgi:hypothetical protein